MRKYICKLCGCTIEPGAIEWYHVVPAQIIEQAGLPESLTLGLCSNCRRDIDDWYASKVSDMTYDSKSKRFEARSQLEMVKEYESAFNSYVKYKKRTKPT